MTNLPTLHLSLKADYFYEIRDGKKAEEYRLCTPYWEKRLAPHKHYSSIELTLGYPPKDNYSKRIIRPWRGYIRRTITHPHFGDKPVEVFAIHVGA